MSIPSYYRTLGAVRKSKSRVGAHHRIGYRFWWVWYGMVRTVSNRRQAGGYVSRGWMEAERGCRKGPQLESEYRTWEFWSIAREFCR